MYAIKIDEKNKAHQISLINQSSDNLLTIKSKTDHNSETNMPYYKLLKQYLIPFNHHVRY